MRKVDAVLLRPALAMSGVGPALPPIRPRPGVWERVPSLLSEAAGRHRPSARDRLGGTAGVRRPSAQGD
eukprot:11121280-Alexandrium_andersonii.AAC.1